MGRGRFIHSSIGDDSSKWMYLKGWMSWWQFLVKLMFYFSSMWHGVAERFSWQPVYWGGSPDSSQWVFRHFTSEPTVYFCKWIVFRTAPMPACSLSSLLWGDLQKRCMSLWEMSGFVSLFSIWELEVNVLWSLGKCHSFPLSWLLSTWPLSNQNTMCYLSLKTFFLCVKICRMGKALAK